MTKATTWADVTAGDAVELKGATWRVEKAKLKGKRVKVRVRSAAGVFEREVKAKEPVVIVKAPKGKPDDDGPLRDAKGAQRRWATGAEAARDGMREDLGLPGGKKRASAPAVTRGPKWDAPATDPAGHAVETILGAQLVAETPDETAGYFVPPPDVTTIRAHLTVFHGMPGNEQPVDEARCLEVHRAQHDDEGTPLAVNHWHAKRRPGAGS